MFTSNITDLIQGSAGRFHNLTESQSGDVVTVTARLVAGREDQGRLVCCHAEQFDNSQPRLSLDIEEQVVSQLVSHGRYKDLGLGKFPTLF